MGTMANSENPDEIPYTAVFNQCLHYLLTPNRISDNEIHLLKLKHVSLQYIHVKVNIDLSFTHIFCFTIYMGVAVILVNLPKANVILTVFNQMHTPYKIWVQSTLWFLRKE